MEKTLGIIKPEAVAAGHTEKILEMIEASGLNIEAKQNTRLSREQAESFYQVHQERPFFDELVTYMCSSPVLVFVASGTNAVERYRELIGSTDPSQAAEGTIRKRFGKDKGHNAVHGSDSSENALKEIAFFFT